MLSVEKHEGSAVAGLARNNSLRKTREREHAVRNGLKAGGGNDGGKPNAQLAVKSKGLLKRREPRQSERFREERRIDLIKRSVDGMFKYNELVLVVRLKRSYVRQELQISKIN